MINIFKSKRLQINEIEEQLEDIRDSISNLDDKITGLTDKMNGNAYSFPNIYEELIRTKDLYFSGTISNDNNQGAIFERYIELNAKYKKLLTSIKEIEKKLKIK